MAAWRWAVEPFTATLAASLLALPIRLYHFGRLSLIAPLANVLMLLLVPYAMLCGAVAMAAGFVWLPLGQLLALLAWPFLHWLVLVADVLARVPGACTTLPPFSVGWVWGWYGLTTLLYAAVQRRAAWANRADTASTILSTMQRDVSG